MTHPHGHFDFGLFVELTELLQAIYGPDGFFEGMAVLRTVLVDAITRVNCHECRDESRRILLQLDASLERARKQYPQQ